MFYAFLRLEGLEIFPPQTLAFCFCIVL